MVGRLLTDNTRGVIFAIDNMRIRIITLNNATAPQGTSIVTVTTPGKSHWKARTQAPATARMHARMHSRTHARAHTHALEGELRCALFVQGAGRPFG